MIIGDGRVGKTCLLQRFNEDTFTEDHNPTIFDTLYRDIDHEGETRRIGLVFHLEIKNSINWLNLEGASILQAGMNMHICAIFPPQKEEL